MADFNYLKQENVTATAQVTHKEHGKQNLTSALYSYDKNISKIVIPVIVASDKELDFEKIKRVRILLTFNHEGVQKSIEDVGVVESTENKTLSYIVTDKLKGYEGSVTMNIYLDLTTDQQIDLVEYGFSMKRSMIDQNIPEIEQFYFKTLDDVIVELQQKADEMLDKINVESAEAFEKIEALEEQIITNEIVKKDVFEQYQNDIAATAQLLKVTKDTGEQIATAGGNKTLLQIILDQGAGVRAISASSTATDNPTSQALRGTALMNTSTSGNFVGMTEDGRFYARAISQGQWSGEWQIGFNVTNQPLLYRSTRIVSQDWDTLKTSGVFYVNNTSGLNKPANAAPYGYLTVMTSVSAVMHIYHDINNQIFTRRYSPSADAWSAWEMLLKDTTGVQMNKVTADDGQALIIVKGSTLLDTFLAKGAGLYTFLVGNGATPDGPKGTFRGLVNMTRPTIGHVLGVTDSGDFYYRNIEGSTWKNDWQRLIPESEFKALADRVAELESKVN